MAFRIPLDQPKASRPPARIPGTYTDVNVLCTVQAYTLVRTCVKGVAPHYKKDLFSVPIAIYHSL
jgi:hypothetical protein